MSDTPTQDYSAQDPKAAHFCDPIERAILSAILNDRQAWTMVATTVAPVDFARQERQIILRGMHQGKRDFASLEHWLHQQGEYDHVFPELLNVFNDPAGMGGINPDWIDEIHICALRRTLWHTSQQLASLSLRADLDTPAETLQWSERLRTLAEEASDIWEEATPAQTLAELIDTYWEAVVQRKKGAPTGLGDLDKHIGGGLQPERLYILLGGTGSGKTTLANQIAEEIANAGRPVFYITSEDTPSALLAKTVARLSQMDYSAVLYGYNTARAKIDEALAQVMGRPSSGLLLYLHDTGALSLEQMQEQARAHFKCYAEKGPGVLVIDYLQRLARMQPGQNGRVDTRDIVTAYTMRLRAVAEHLGCSVLALSSISRASYNGKTDWLAAAKESGDIEYTADCVLGLAPESEQQGDVVPYTLKIAKNRLGASGETIKLAWKGSCQTFAALGR